MLFYEEQEIKRIESAKVNDPSFERLIIGSYRQGRSYAPLKTGLMFSYISTDRIRATPFWF